MGASFPRRLLDGYSVFRHGRLPVEQHRYKALAEAGQRPEIMVIGCCDSRVSPEVVFDARPGELFVLRNVANLVPPYTPDSQQHGVSAAIEFAVNALQVRHIVVLGHARCGGVHAYATKSAPLSSGDFIGRWISLLGPAAEAIGLRGDTPLETYLERLEQMSIVKAMDNLLTFPFVSDRVDTGALTLHGAYFDVANGLLRVGDPETVRFEPVGLADNVG